MEYQPCRFDRLVAMHGDEIFPGIRHHFVDLIRKNVIAGRRGIMFSGVFVKQSATMDI